MATCSCDWKCLKEQNLPASICQNSHTSNMNTKLIEIKDLISKFNDNLLSDCVIFAGLEPILQYEEVYSFIEEFRKTNSEDVVIYTGYYMHEILDKVNRLKKFGNIYIKFGRYNPNLNPKYDEIGQVELISENQFFKKIS